MCGVVLRVVVQSVALVCQWSVSSPLSCPHPKSPSLSSVWCQCGVVVLPRLWLSVRPTVVVLLQVWCCEVSVSPRCPLPRSSECAVVGLVEGVGSSVSCEVDPASVCVCLVVSLVCGRGGGGCVLGWRPCQLRG